MPSDGGKGTTVKGVRVGMLVKATVSPQCVLSTKRSKPARVDAFNYSLASKGSNVSLIALRSLFARGNHRGGLFLS